MMAFAMALPRAKRVKVIAEDGKEEFVERNAWEVLRDADYALKDEPVAETTTTSEADTEAAPAPEQPPSATQVLEKFISARGEMDVIIDLINNLEIHQFLSVASTPHTARTLADLAQETALRIQTKRKQLKDVGEILRRGTEMLRDKLNQDDVFFRDVGCLQRKWKVKLDASGGAGPLAAFYVDLSFTLRPGHALTQTQQDAPERTVELIRDPGGHVAVVDKAGQAGESGEAVMAVGVDAVEALLRRQQWCLMLKLSRGQLSHELSDVKNKDVARGRVDSIMAVVESDSASHNALRYRPLMMALLLECLQDGGGSMVGTLRQIMAHDNLKAYVEEQFQEQLEQLPHVTLHWINTFRPATAAVRITIAKGVRGVLIIEGEELKVEGFSSLFDAVRWSATGSMIFTKHDIPTMLTHLSSKHTHMLRKKNISQHKPPQENGISIELPEDS